MLPQWGERSKKIGIQKKARILGYKRIKKSTQPLAAKCAKNGILETWGLFLLMLILGAYPGAYPNVLT